MTTRIIYSEELKQHITIEILSPGKMKAKAEDGTEYDVQEMQKLNAAHVKVPLAVHLLKGAFKGTIYKVGN